MPHHENGLTLGPLTGRTVHLCVDMQRLFSREGPWPTPWLHRVLPTIEGIAARRPERTIFTRFIPPSAPEGMPGAWRRYYEHWRCVTGERLDPAMLDLMDSLRALTPPARVVDKAGYSAFSTGALRQELQALATDALVVTGGETDVCVLATVMDAVDLGYRTVLATDALCSSSDEGHDALLALFGRRFRLQVETADAATILGAWPAGDGTDAGSESRERSAPAAGS